MTNITWRTQTEKHLTHGMLAAVEKKSHYPAFVFRSVNYTDREPARERVNRVKVHTLSIHVTIFFQKFISICTGDGVWNFGFFFFKSLSTVQFNISFVYVVFSLYCSYNFVDDTISTRKVSWALNSTGIIGRAITK